MNKNIFLRGTALTLALLLCLMTCFGSISMVKAVGEEAEVRMISFPRDGEANYEGWGHPEMHYMNGWIAKKSSHTNIRAMEEYDGNICYCIEPGVIQNPGDTFTSWDENFWDNFPEELNVSLSGDEIKSFIGRILQYGYTGPVSVNWRSQNEGGDKLAQAVATQLLIWETIVGERDGDFGKLDPGEYDAVTECITTAHPLYERIHSYDKEENIYQKLTSVYASAASAGVNVAMLIKASPEEGVELYLGACDEDDRENGALPKARLLYNSFVGNFPGCRTSKDSVILDTQSTQAVINRSFDPIKYHAAASVSSIASLRGQQHDEKNNAFYQGIEKAVEAMDGSDYAVLILARALPHEEIRVMQDELEMLHTQLNPFAKTSFSVNASNSEGTSKTMSDSITKTMSETKSHTLGIGKSNSVSKTEGKFSSNSLSIGVGIGKKNSPFSISPSYARSWGKNEATTQTTGENTQESDTVSLADGQSTSVTTSDGTTVTLVDVTVACNEDPREDAIVCVVKKAGRMLNETWDNATKAYEDAWKNVNEGIDVVARASQEAGELFEQFIAKHR